MQRAASVCLFVAACSSSPAPTAPPSVARVDAGALPAIDGAQAPPEMTVAPPDAAPVTPPLPEQACLPFSEPPATLALDGGRARLCWSRTPWVYTPDTCLWIGRDGAATIGDAPPGSATRYPTIRYLDASGEEAVEDEERGYVVSAVEVCVAEASCRTITPTDPPDAIQSASVDDAGEHVAILLQEDPLDGGAVTIYRVADGKPLASATMGWDDHHGVHYAIEYLGTLLLWVEFPGATPAANGALWQRKGSKLRQIAEIGGRTYAYARAGTHLVFAGTDLQVEVHDASSGKAMKPIVVDELVRDGVESEAWDEGYASLDLAAEGDEVVVAAIRDAFARVAFVKLPKRKPTIVDVARCSPE